MKCSWNILLLDKEHPTDPLISRNEVKKIIAPTPYNQGGFCLHHHGNQVHKLSSWMVHLLYQLTPYVLLSIQDSNCKFTLTLFPAATMALTLFRSQICVYISVITYQA